VIVVVGSPIAQPEGSAIEAGGLGAVIARSAAGAGAAVEIVGRVGEDAAGDAVLLSLAAAGVGHVAVLREPGRPTPSAPPRSGASPSPDGPALGEELAAEIDDGAADADPAGLSVDAADLELALRYVPDYRVVIVAADLDASAFGAVVGAASWAGARLVILLPGGAAAGADAIPAEATVLERPASDADGAFGAMVAAYAVALDQGDEPATAFAAAQRAGGWAPVAG
jgi:hypothetical protein